MLQSVLLCALMNASALFAAWRLALRFTPVRSLTHLGGATLLSYFALITAVTTILGHIGMLKPELMLAASLVLAANAMILLPVPESDGTRPFARILLRPLPFDSPGAAVAMTLIALASILLAMLFALSVRTAPHSYDALTYHLFFPARWLQEGRLFIVPTPFGDPAPAYAPSNTELFYLWLMAPFRADVLARAGQFVYLMLGLLAMRGLATRLGATHGASVAAVFLFLLNSLVLYQAGAPEVDLAMTALCLAALWFAAEYRASFHAGHAALCGIAAGLFLGTKFLSAVYFPVVLAAILLAALAPTKNAPLKRRLAHLGLCLALIALAGGYWYGRNWVETGNPLFPAAVSLGGWTLFDGPVTREAMQHSIFHVQDARWLPLVAAHAVGLRMVPLLGLLWLVGGVLTLWRKLGAARILLWLSPVPFVLLYAFAVPYNKQYRFLLPAVALLWLGTLPIWEKKGVVRALFALVTTGTAAWCFLVDSPGLVWGTYELPPLGLWHPDFAATLLCAWAALIGIGYLLWRRERLRVAAVPIAFVVALAGTLLAWQPLNRGGPPLRVGLTRPQSLPWAAWEYLRANVAGETIAYAGTNAPYYLLGSRCANEAVYVNVNGRSGWRLDHYFADAVAKRNRPEPSDKPAIHRERPDYDKWHSALLRRGATLLWVQTMGADERRRLSPDAEGFPIERRWARARPSRFEPVYSGPRVEIYRVVSGPGS